MHKPASEYIVISLFLLILPVVSYSQNSYQVEVGAGFARDKENSSEMENTALVAEIFFDEITTDSHPYAEAAFLKQASSLTAGYLDNDFTSTVFEYSEDVVLLGVNYVVPDSLVLFQAGYIAGDGEYRNGLRGDFKADGIFVGIGKYVTDHSTIIVNYSQLDGEANFVPSTTSTIKTTEIGVEYKTVEKLQGDAAFNFEASLASSDTDINTTSETNTIIGFSGDYYLDKSISVGASLEINSGDDKSDEGKTVGLNLSMFLTPSFAVFVEFNQFIADDASGDDSDEVAFGGVARF